MFKVTGGFAHAAFLELELCSYSQQSNMPPVGVGLHQGCPLSLSLFVIFIGRISRCRQSVRFGFRLTFEATVFEDDVVLLVPSDLQQGDITLLTQCPSTHPSGCLMSETYMLL